MSLLLILSDDTELSPGPPVAKNAVLLESGDYILLEDGSVLLLE